METGRLKLSYLEGESSLINGDLIVTSGLGGYYPSQLVIGSVEEIRTDDNGLTRYAVLAPKTDLDSLSRCLSSPPSTPWTEGDTMSRRDTIWKWVFYTAGVFLLLLLQGLALDHISLLHVHPYLPPVMVAVLAMFEGA